MRATAGYVGRYSAHATRNASHRGATTPALRPEGTRQKRHRGESPGSHARLCWRGGPLPARSRCWEPHGVMGAVKGSLRGEVGDRLTLGARTGEHKKRGHVMATLDPFGNDCDRKLRIHIRRMHHQSYDWYHGLRCAQQVFGSIGVLVEVGSMQTANVPLLQVGRFAAIQGPWDWNTTDADRFAMYTQYGTQDLNSITVYLVHSLSPLTNRAGTPKWRVVGAATSPVQRQSVYLGVLAGPWDMAHELVHSLLGEAFEPVHEDHDPGNLMFPVSRWEPTTPTLNDRQKAAIRSNPIVAVC